MLSISSLVFQNSQSVNIKSKPVESYQIQHIGRNNVDKLLKQDEFALRFSGHLNDSEKVLDAASKG